MTLKNKNISDKKILEFKLECINDKLLKNERSEVIGISEKLSDINEGRISIK